MRRCGTKWWEAGHRRIGCAVRRPEPKLRDDLDRLGTPAHCWSVICRRRSECRRRRVWCMATARVTNGCGVIGPTRPSVPGRVCAIGCGTRVGRGSHWEVSMPRRRATSRRSPARCGRWNRSRRKRFGRGRSWCSGVLWACRRRRRTRRSGRCGIRGSGSTAIPSRTGGASLNGQLQGGPC